MKFTPTNDNVLIKRAESDSVTDGGLIIPENAKRQSDRGEVVAVGPGPFIEGTNKRRGMGIEVGMTVCFRRFAGEEIELDGVPHIILKEDQIEGVVEG